MQIRITNVLVFVILLNIFIDSFGTLIWSIEVLSWVRAITLSLIIVYMFLSTVNYNGLVKYLMLILLFFFMLLFFSSSFQKSFERYLKFAISLSFLPISYSIIKEKHQLITLNNALIIVAIAVVFNVALSTLLGLDTKGYKEDSGFSTGNMFSGGLFSGVYFVLLSPLIIKQHSIFSKKIVVFLIISLVVIIILAMKRSTILVMIFGLLMYSILNRKLLNKYTILLIIGGSITFYTFGEVLQSRIASREEKLQVDSIQEEARVIETKIITQDVFSFNDPVYSFFGKELFNTVGNYADGAYGTREIHNDYMVLLHGSGLVGLSLYLLLFILLYKRFMRNYKYNRVLLREYYVFFVILLLTSLLISFNGGIAAIGYRSISFIYIGALLGIVENNNLKQQYENNIYPNRL